MKRTTLHRVLLAVLVIASVAVTAPFWTRWHALPSTELKQLVVDDLVYIRLRDELLCYQVDAIRPIDAQDTIPDEPITGQDSITLVTGTPSCDTAPRLAVQAHRIPTFGSVVSWPSIDVIQLVVATIVCAGALLYGVWLWIETRKKAQARRETAIYVH